MYIAPTTSIRLLTGVPLDGDYENTLYFNSLADQITYFRSKTKYHEQNCTFQRVTKGIMRVGQPVNNLYDVNYIMFQNTGFGSKWFYAFVDSVEYINNATTEIRFTIDVMQTWFFDYNLEQCFVERCHSATDTIGDNILPEPVELGEMIYNSYGRVISSGDDMLTNVLYILAINDVSGNNAFAGVYDRVPSGAKLWAFKSDDISGLEAKITEYIQRPTAITALYTVPKRFVSTQASFPQTGGEEITSPKVSLVFNKFVDDAHKITNSSTINGYTPKNKKLFTYPYNFLEVITGMGSALNLRYEFFSGNPGLSFQGCITQPVSVAVKPVNYKGGGATPATAVSDEQLVLDGYPMGSWLNDAYEAWVAQNSVPLALGTISSVSSGFIGGLATGNIGAAFAGAGMAGLGQITNILTERYNASIAADQQHGNPSSGNVNFSADTLDVFCGRRSVQAQYARAIDDFFTMYGYAQKKVMTPPRKNRSQFTYVKTVGCQGSGSVPNDDKREIDAIYNKGIRFWTTPANVGNFSVTNSLLP